MTEFSKILTMTTDDELCSLHYNPSLALVSIDRHDSKSNFVLELARTGSQCGLFIIYIYVDLYIYIYELILVSK